MRLAELMKEAGLPDGVLNVVNGDKEAVDTLLTDPRVAAVSFVGSTAIGRYIYATGCANGKRVQALCGAKNHLVVMPDADMDQVTDALMGAAYGSAGERCMAISVAVAVGDKTGDEVIKRLAPRVRALKVGPHTDPEAEMGPMVTQDSLARIKGYIDAGVREGAELVVDGRQLAMQGLEKGYFLGGCLFDRVTPEMSIYTDEIFGPVLGVVRVDGLRDGPRPGERSPVRQRHGDLHPRRRRRARLRRPGPGRHGRRQRADSGAGGLPQLRRLEAVAVRRSARLWSRQCQVLHQGQGGDSALAVGHPRRRPVQLQEHVGALSRWPRGEARRCRSMIKRAAARPSLWAVIAAGCPDGGAAVLRTCPIGQNCFQE